MQVSSRKAALAAALSVLLAATAPAGGATATVVARALPDEPQALDEPGIAFWAALRNRVDAISYPRYRDVIDRVFCAGSAPLIKNLAESWKMINYLTGNEGMAAWTGLGLAMPTRTDLQAPWVEQYPEQKPFMDGATYSYPWQFVSGFQAVLDTMNSGLQQVFAGMATPEQVLAEAEQVGNSVLAGQ